MGSTLRRSRVYGQTEPACFGAKASAGLLEHSGSLRFELSSCERKVPVSPVLRNVPPPATTEPREPDDMRSEIFR